MQHTIVEGEPGVFPEPVARVMRAISGFFNRHHSERRDPSPDAKVPGPPAEDPDAKAPGPPAEDPDA